MPASSFSISVPDAMARSDFYPGAPAVTVCQTHTAWVFLAGEHAYKVKKPVRMEFLDFSSLDRRREVCREELRVNCALAATLDMRLRSVVADGDAYALAEADVPDAVEYVLQMRRFDEQRTMAALAGRGELGDADVRAVAGRIAEFHAAATVIETCDPAGDVTRAWDHNARELLALADDETAQRVLAADRFAGAFLVAHRHVLAARAGAGRIRDGHGDLRAEHVVLEQPLAIIDRLEFDARLREIDVADDLAFLVMDLERLGAGDAAGRLVAAYRDAGGDPGSDELIAFYGAYRALVRAKVDLLRATQLDDPVQPAVARADAHALLDLAEHFAWRARGPLVLAVSGPPACGKSTLAGELARRSGWPVLSSDAVRKQADGLELSARAPDERYTPAARATIYSELGVRAAAAVERGESVIVDATFGQAPLRALFLDGLGAAGRGRLRAIECCAPAALRERWARERTAHDAHGSDADPAIAARLAADHSGWDELAAVAIIILRTGVGGELLAGQVADWLDTTAGGYTAMGAAGFEPATSRG